MDAKSGYSLRTQLKSAHSIATQHGRKSTYQPSALDAGRFAYFEQDIVQVMKTYRLFEHKSSTIRWQDEKKDFFENLDIEALLENIKLAKIEKTRLSSENYLLKSFLTKNDKMLLLGQGALYMTRESIIKSLKSQVFQEEDEDDDDSSRLGDARSVISRRSMASRRSMISHRSKASRRSGQSRRSTLRGTQSRTDKAERKLNYMTKAALAHREKMTLEKRISRFEKNSKEMLETTRAKIVELDMRRREVYLTEDNFLMNFARTPENLKFLRDATELQLSTRFSKFISGISKNAKTFKCTMHLTIDTIQNQSHQLFNSIIAHTDLHKTLTEPDHEVLEIRLHEMLDEYKVKQKSAAEYQQITFLKSTELSKENRKFQDDDVEYTQVTKQIKCLTISIERLKKEREYFKKSNNDTILKIVNLRNQLHKFHAPSVADYMTIKGRYEKLLKERKVLLRQTNLLKLKKTKR